jgi:PAS domain S-box-containing protein
LDCDAIAIHITSLWSGRDDPDIDMITADFVGAPRDAASPNRLRLFIAAAGATLACLGLVVIVGWHVGSTVLIRLLQPLAAMQYATALGFLAAGLSLVFFSRGRRVAGAVLAALVAALGAATLLHYDAGMDLGPLKAMLVPDLEAGALNPGRTGTGTALAFLLSGAALIMCAVHRPDRRCAGAVGILGAVVLGLGVVALSGYIVKPASSHGWSEFTQMALHTSVGVVALGSALLALALHGHAQVSAAAPRWLAVAAGIGALTVVVAIWHSLLAEDARKMQTRLDLAADNIADHLSAELRGNTLALERMARRWTGDGVDARDAWAADARSYIDHEPAYQALVWIDQEYRFRWVEGAGRLRGARFGPETALGRILASVREQDRPSPRWMADLPAGGPGVLLVVPLRDGGEFHGFMAGFLRFPDFVDETVLHPETAGNTVILYDGRNEIYRHEGVGVEAASAWRAEARIDSRGLAWRAAVLPGAEMLGQLHGTVANILVAVGAALSVVLGLSVHFAQTAARRTHVVEDAHRELKENIRERMAAEGAAARLGHILDHSFNEIYLFDADSLRFVQVNQGAQRNLGYSMEELRDMTPVDIKADFDHAQFADLIAPLRDGAEDQVVLETAHRRKDGTIYPVEARLQLSRSGARPVFVAIVQDITARRQSEEALRESEQRYRNLIEDSALGVIVHRAGRVLFANRAVARMLGHGSPADILALKDVQSCVAPEDRARTTGYAEARMRGEEVPTDYEFRAIRKDGSLAWLRNQVVVVTWDGEPAIQTHWTDVTERKRAEEALRESEASLANAQRIARIGNWDWNILTNELLWSDEMYRLWGQTTKEFGATYDAFLETVHPDDRERVEGAVNKALADGAPYNIPHRIVLADGTERIINEQGEVTFDDDGKPIRMSGTGQDVTETVQAEERAKRAQDQLVDAVESLSEGFALIGADDRLVLTNSRFRDFYGNIDEHKTPGTHMKDITLAVARTGLIEEAVGREAEWARERLESHRRPQGPIERRLGADRWIMINERRTRDGSMAMVCTDITELKQRETELRLSEQRFKDFAEVAADWFWETDTDDRLTASWRETSDGVERNTFGHLGATRAEIYDGPTDTEAWRTYFASLEARNPIRDFVYPLKDTSGAVRWMRVNGKPRYGPDSTFLGYYGSTRDITAQIEAEESAKQAQQRLAASVEALSEQFVLFDADDRLVLGNKAWRDFNREIEESIRPGTHYNDFSRAALRAGMYPEAVGREEEWLRQRLIERKNPSGPQEFERSGNRWTLVNDQQLPDGGVATILTDITEIKRREEALRESEARAARAHDRLRDAIESLEEGFALFDSDDNLALTNSRWLDHYEPVREVFQIGANFHDIQQRLIATGTIVAARGREQEWVRERTARFENPSGPIERQLGDDRWLMISERRTCDGGTVVVTTDITALKEREAALRESEARAARAHERLVDAIESLPASFFLYDAENRLVLCNSEAGKHFPELSDLLKPGTPWEDLLRRVVETGAIPEASEGGEAWIRERIEAPRDPPLVREHELADGRTLQLIERTTSEGGTVGIRLDITERKRAEAELRESEARLRRAITDAPIPIMLHAEDGEVLLISREWTEITGYAPTEIPTLEDWMRKAYGAMHKERKAHVEALYDRDTGSRHGEFEIMTASSETRVWDFSNGPLGAMPDGRRIMISMAIDVTERKVAETEIKKLNEGLEKRVEERTAELRTAQGELVKKERLATLGQLTATVSHELRNPLAAMRASAHVIGVALNHNQARARRAVQRIDRGIVRCDHIIDELLDYTRIRDLDPTATFLDEWLDEVIGEQDMPDRVRVARECGLSGATAMFDPNRLRRAVINVFDNACQAMVEDEDDSGDHCLTVRTHQSDGWIEIEFQDDGSGIPPDIEARIFEPLFSTKGFGVGLGLPVVKQIMEQHGGTVEVETEPGRGTRVRLRLPRR